jgi:hypothetical protein
MAKDEQKTDIVPIFGMTEVDIVNSEKLVAAMEDTADEGGRAGDVSYMSFSGKRGSYSIGVDKRQPGEAEPFLVAITAFELGWIAWKGGNPVSKRMASISKPKVLQPDPDDQGPFDTGRGDGWHRARAITVRSMENGEQCYFSINSKSGVAVLSDLQRDVLDNMKAGQPCWPVITFGMEEFESQGYKNFKPVIDVIAWLDTEEVQQLADPEFDPMSLLGETEPEPQKQAPAPKPRRRL